ncbi:RNA polymerase sigma factor [Streptomyces tricolor]
MTSPDEQDFGVIEPAGLPTDFEAFFARHMNEFLRVAGARTRNPHDAEEVVMEAAVQMFRKWPRILAHPRPIALAHRILANKITDFYRYRARTAGREVSYDELSYAEVPTPDELLRLRGHDQLDRALAELEKRAPLQAQCIILHYYADLDFTEIANCLEITVGAARANAHLGRKKLVHLIDLPESGKGKS